MTGLFVTVGDVTKTVRVRRRTINLDKVSKINMMSRDIADDKIDFEEALKRFKRECEKNGILKEIKRRETYTPPSVRRKLKSQEAQRRMRRTKRKRF
jgi:small subunit ribosomal protein S21